MRSALRSVGGDVLGGAEACSGLFGGLVGGGVGAGSMGHRGVKKESQGDVPSQGVTPKR